MRLAPRPDEFETRRARLRDMNDEALHAYFWDLVEKIVAPLVAEARTHTTPSIERSVLLRMGLSSLEAKALVQQGVEHRLLARGMGRVLLEYAQARDLPLREAAVRLCEGTHWHEIGR